MSPKNHRDFDMVFLMLMSLLGLLLIAVLTAFPPKFNDNIPWRKPLIGSIFSLICILGNLAALSPTRCLKILEFRKRENPSNSILGKSVTHRLSPTMQGHHPGCGNFSAHIFRIRSRTFCAACTGLLLGGLFALIGAFVYFFGEWHIGGQSNYLIVFLGILGVSFGLFQFKVKNLARSSLNAFFVLGALLILIGIDESVHSLMLDLFLVTLILFWLFTRISLSQWDHNRICSACYVADCDLAYWKKGREV